MRLFHDFPLQRKLLLITMSICAIVLLVAMSTLFGFQILSFRSNFKRDIATLATIIANNSTAALAIEDRKTATEIISSLKAKPAVLFACLMDAKGNPVARFGSENDQAGLDGFPGPDEFRFVNGDMLYTEFVNLEGKAIGKLYLRVDYHGVLLELLHFYGLVIVLVIAVTSLLALRLSKALGRIVTVPVLSLAETVRFVGEKNDYSARSSVASHADEVGVLAKAFNHMLERIQSQDAALSLSQQKLESLVHSIDGIVWERDPKTAAFTFVSQQCSAMLGYPHDSWINDATFWERLVHPEDFDRVSMTCTEAVSRRMPYNHEYRVIASDRRIVWIHESAVILVENGQPIALRGIFRDITDQRAAQDELERLNRRLVDTSRQAGMAEVATGVLHNVGNVLNSVNVSATLVQEQMDRSKMSTLEQATGLLRDHLPDAAEYISKDPKGRLLPEFLIKVTELAASEQASWKTELKALRKNVEHMKEIVSMQQSYARVAGVFESLSSRDLVEDALQINSAGLNRHGVEVIRQYQAVPKIIVDKHKVMQILINLIRNAKYALDGTQQKQKLLTIQILLGSPGKVRIVVQDNGIGIPKENLTKIFSHGFTTRKDGHGFGLHSGALAAKELGGVLTAQSDGLGTGATFSVELPISTETPDSL